MTTVNQQELNNFIFNFYGDVGTLGGDTSRKQWLIENLSNVGRYAFRDFERFGNYVSSWLQATNGCIPTLTGFPTAICSLSGDDSDSMSTDRYC